MILCDFQFFSLEIIFIDYLYIYFFFQLLYNDY